MKTFVIGDVHGKLDMLLGLLIKAGIFTASGVRADEHHDTRIIQVGDLGNFTASSRTEDYAVYRFAAENGIEVLWGNHDHAIYGPRFSGYDDPMQLTFEMVEDMAPKYTAVSHGFLISHAGLHPRFVPPIPEAEEAADWMHRMIAKYETKMSPIIIDIGPPRGGFQTSGGLLWRDADREKLARIPQIFGHSKGYVRRFHQGQSFCIDAGVRSGNLAGIWLPSLTVVAIGPDAEINMVGQDAY